MIVLKNLHVYLSIFHRDDFHNNTIIKMKYNYRLFMIEKYMIIKLNSFM